MSFGDARLLRANHLHSCRGRRCQVVGEKRQPRYEAPPIFRRNYKKKGNSYVDAAQRGGSAAAASKKGKSEAGVL